MAALLVMLVLSGIGGHENGPWDAAMCFTGRYQEPRYYFSECTQPPLDWEAWCAPFKTRFSIRIRRPTRAECLDVVRHNQHPEMWRYRKVEPLMCDYNRGPLPDGC